MKIVGIVFLIDILAVGVVGALVYNNLKKTLPDPSISNALGRDQSSTITDRNGKILTTLYADQNRKDISFNAMPQQLRQAVVATEDKRFYEHAGVDPVGIMRALIIDIAKGANVQGGSTITQQYIKQAFVGSQKTAKRKLQEAMMAIELDKKHSKDKILALYLNTIYFGHGAYGVQSAAEVYFGKNATDLDLQECATIAAVIKSPGLYSPYLEPKAALQRRNTVLKLMLDQNLITQPEYATASTSPLKTVGLKTAQTKAPYFVEWIKKQAIKQYGENAVYRGGLTIKTTLDCTKQKEAEDTIKTTLNKKNDPSASLVSIDPKTGEILALVGGKDFNTQQFDVATQGKRQPGSAFKTFVLAAALEQGISPEAVYETKARSFKVGNGVWKVTGSSSGPQTLRTSTVESINAVFAQVILDIGVDKVVNMANRLGIKEHINPVPAIALGGLTTGVSPLEMASAYGTLANGGTYATPFGILSVTDSTGKVVDSNEPLLKKDVVSPEVAYLTTDILKGVLKTGTGTVANIGREAAGKTGTTQEYRDAWFVGYTPDVSTSVWVGDPASQKAMLDVHGIAVTGGSFPAQIWASYMKAALVGTPKSKFSRPAGLTKIKICTETGLRANPYCPSTKYAYSVSKENLDVCTKHKKPASATTSSETTSTP
ncbi:MAG: PBP1A family penicillin-binding protein [Coriobacteriia bacterium]|nr:PBP1A family penicillin-binding protein [Coriobacteriia bacterium]